MESGNRWVGARLVARSACPLHNQMRLGYLELVFKKYNRCTSHYSVRVPMKTLLLVTCLAIAASNAHADAIKYRQADGKMLISNQGAGDGAKALSAHRDEYIPSYQQQAAQRDVERQREFVKSRERESRPVVALSESSVSGQNDIPKLQSCLMNATAVAGHSPSQEASRKVACYGGTVGLNDDCHRSVGATMRLSTQEENYYKSQCPR